MRAQESRARALLVALAGPVVVSIAVERSVLDHRGESAPRETGGGEVIAPEPHAKPDEARSNASRGEARPVRAPELVEPRPELPGRTPAIEDAAALEPFFAALARTARGEAKTRVTHLGDSSIGNDALPHAIRARFARALGDGGPGYVYLDRESPSYDNRTIRLRSGPHWDVCVMIRRCKRDARYGLAGVAFESRGGARTRIEPGRGRQVSRAELWYLAQPRGGRLGFSFGGGPEQVIDTRADHLESRWTTIARAPGEHSVQVRALGGGPVRAFGVVLEREGPGVVWDSLGVVGAFTHRVLAPDEAHFAEQLAHRDPDLVVLSYGGNDLRRMIFGHVDRARLEEETLSVLARVRAAVPGAACLVLGISDHSRSGSARVRPEHVSTVLDAQRSAAARAGCAFWDTTRAMGGPGTFARWRREGLAAGDGKHLNEQGRRLIAERLVAALRHAQAGHAQSAELQSQPRAR